MIGIRTAESEVGRKDGGAIFNMRGFFGGDFYRNL